MSPGIKEALTDLHPLVRAGYRFWRAVRPWRRMKVWRNKKREAKGKPPIPLSEDDMALFPKGTMRKTGIAALASSPFVGMAAGMIARLAGFGEECTPEAIELGCVPVEVAAKSLGDLIGSALGLVGGYLYWRGFNRAHPKE